MNENYSIGRVYSRAWAQLKWNFWPVLGFVAIAYIAGSTISSLITLPFSIGMVAFSFPAGSADMPLDPAAMFRNPAIVVSALLAAVLVILMYIMSLQASIYRETRLVHEGVAGHGLQDVFQ